LLPEEWEQAKALFAEARKLDSSKREGFLRQACWSNGAVLREVESLLAAESQVGSFLETETREMRAEELVENRALLVESFSVTDRFLLKKLLGYGGFGVVYEAYDRHREMPVALKRVRRSDPVQLYLIKREFRSLVGVAHPNLVRLYELFSEGATYFFTMELLAGVNFVRYVRDPGARSRFDLPRLREALAQLVEGVEALHRLGMLHRDIKPGNVMVTSEGRVVLLDFGLVKDVSAVSFQQSLIGGTPCYMSPEQFERRPLTPATDWYAVGVMLYEVLTGRHPFSGDFIEVLHQKQADDLVSPAQVMPGIPPELDRLCSELLARQPEQRPDGRAILRTLELAVEPAPRLIPEQHTSPTDVIVGRETHIATLMDQFRRVLDGQAVIVNVYGPSGMGKTTLLQAFSHRLQKSIPEALILSGRCHESEAVPFKALDSLIDDLGRHLGRLPDSEREAIVPRDFQFLERLFPVLRQIGERTFLGPKTLEISDSKEVRKRAFHSLLELFRRLAERRPLVVIVDDLQWSDLDSAVFFDYFLRASSPPGLLFIASYRSETIADNPFLIAYREHLNSTGLSVAVADLEVSELSLSETRQLLEHLAPEDAEYLTTRTEIIARDTGGCPFLITQFAYFGLDPSVAGREPYPAGTEDQPLQGLSGIIMRRAALLPGDARRLLEAVAVAGQPVLEAVAVQAAELSDRDDRALTLLISAKFLKRRETGGTKRIEAYHDRIRESVSANLPEPSRRSLHKRIAEALQLHDPVDYGLVAGHYQQAGERGQAAEFALQAAETARKALAFDQEARFYRLSLELREEHGPDTAMLRRKLADALVNAGRGVEAADAYEDAARTAMSVSERTQLGLRAAEEYLRGGQIDQGISILRSVAASVGVRLSENVGLALMALGWNRTRLWLRGLHFRERRLEEIPERDLMRLEVYWAVAAGFSGVNQILASAFQTKHLLLALRAGEPNRLAMSLAFEGMFVGFRGERDADRARRIFHAARELALRSSSPRALGYCDLAEATWSLLTGRFGNARECSERAEKLFREQCTGVFWELASARLIMSAAMVWLGDLKELGARLQEFQGDARDRADLYAVTQLEIGGGSTSIYLAADQPDLALQKVQAALANWPVRRFSLQHFYAFFQELAIYLYRGQWQQAWSRCNELMPAMRHSFFLKSQCLRVMWMFSVARAALAAAANEPSDREVGRLLRLVRKLVRRLDRENVTYAKALAEPLQAAVEYMNGNADEALRLMVSAEARFQAAEMSLSAAGVRRSRGQLLGGPEGEKLIASAEAFLQAQGVVNPARFVEAFGLGFQKPRPVV